MRSIEIVSTLQDHHRYEKQWEDGLKRFCNESATWADDVIERVVVCSYVDGMFNLSDPAISANYDKCRKQLPNTLQLKADGKRHHFCQDGDWRLEVEEKVTN